MSTLTRSHSSRRGLGLRFMVGAHLYPPLLFSIYCSLGLRLAENIPQLPPKLIVWKKSCVLLLENEERNGMIRVAATGTCLGAVLFGTQGDQEHPLAPQLCFLGAVERSLPQVCGKKFKPTADRLSYCLQVVCEQFLDQLGFAAKSCEPQVSKHRRSWRM